MKRVSLALAAISVTLSASAIAGDNDGQSAEFVQPIQFGDRAMSCNQIGAEVVNAEVRLGGSPADGLMSGEAAVNLGTGLAQQAALVGGAGGGAVAAIGRVGGILGSGKKKRKAKEAEQRAIAEKRWLYLVGLYHGRGCDTPAAANGAESQN